MSSTFTPPVNTGGYISLPVTVDPNQLFLAAVAAIQAQFPAWVPQEGNLDVAILEEAAQMFSTCAAVSSQVPITIFEYFGGLVGINPIQGVQATAAALFTMTDTAGYTIPAGTPIAYPLSGNQQVLFTVQTTVVIPSGSSTGVATLICETPGTFPNGLAAATCQMVTTFAQVTSIATTAAVSGGVDPETSTAYINRLSAELQLLAPRPILPADFAELATNVAGVYRAMAINGLSPGRTVTDGVTTLGSLTIGSATANFTSLDIGRSVSAASIPTGATIASITSTTVAVLATGYAATASATGETMTFGDLTGQQRCVTVAGLTTAGAALSSTINGEMLAYLQARREVNFVVGTVYPTFTEVDVTVTAYAVPGASTTAVQSAITAALNGFFSPATYGGGLQLPPVWQDTTTVSFLSVAQAIASVPGVLYIPSGDLTIAIHGGSFGSTDLTLPGDAPMPTAGTLSCTVLASS